MFHGRTSIHRVSHGGVCEFSILKYFINLKIQFPQNKRLPKIRKYLHNFKTENEEHLLLLTNNWQINVNGASIHFLI